jgi:hypothetical protein
VSWCSLRDDDGIVGGLKCVAKRQMSTERKITADNKKKIYFIVLVQAHKGKFYLKEN